MGIAFGCLAVALVAGVLARFQTLGGRQWATDEYFFLESVGFILDEGLPAFRTGGYYVRGLALQYLTAGLWLVLGSSTFVARLPSLVFGLGSIGLGYAYARRHVGVSGAIAVAGMLALSSWEIEFSGFARMYSAFQMLTLAFLIALDRASATTGPGRYLPHALLVVVALTHEGAVLLAPLLVLPLLSGRSPYPWREAVAGVAVSLAVVGFISFDFRNLGVGPTYPVDFDFEALEATAGGHQIDGNLTWVPAFPFWSIGDPFTSILGVALLLALAVLPWLVLYSRGRARVEHLWATWLLLAASTHQLVIAGIAGVVLVLRYDLLMWRGASRSVRVLVGAGVGAALAWVAWGLAHVDAWVAEVDPGDLPRTVRLTFLAFPNFFDPIIFPWRDVLPRLGACLAAAFAVRVWVLRKEPVSRLLQDPMAALAVSLACLSVVETPQLTTRYSFYLYPVLLTLLVQGLQDVLRAGRSLGLGIASSPAAAALGAALFALGGDFHPAHIAHPDSLEASYRIGPYRRYEDLWYERIDFRSPAQFLNATLPAETREPIIVVGQDPIARWLERPFAVYLRPNSLAFFGLARDRGSRHIWSGQPIVSTVTQLRDYAAGADAVWIVRSVSPERHGFEAEDAFEPRFVGEHRAYLGEDGRLEVVRVDLTPPGAKAGAGI